MTDFQLNKIYFSISTPGTGEHHNKTMRGKNRFYIKSYIFDCMDSKQNAHLKKQIAEQRKKLKGNKEASIKLLQKLGFLNQKGELKAKYTR